MRTLAKLFSLPPHRRLLLMRAALWLLAMRAAVPLVRLQILRRMLPEFRSRGEQALEDVRWALITAARRVPSTPCLARSLALQALLNTAGIASALRIGVAKDPGGRFSAHAWVESGGRPVLPDENLAHYSLLRLPAPSRG